MADFRQEFPAFDPADMPAIPAGFSDESWHQDSCPSFLNAEAGLMLYVDYKARADREHDSEYRFGLYECDASGTRAPSGYEFETNDWDAVLAQIALRAAPGPEWRREDTGGGLRPWVREISDGRKIFLCDAEGGNLGGRDEPCSFSVWRGDNEIDSQTADDLAEALRMIESLDADDPSKKALPDPDMLADRFVAILATWLTAAQWRDMLAENQRRMEAGDHETCASHDFCDPNQAMLDAWAQCPDAPEMEAQNDAHVAIWNAAWSTAKNRYLTTKAGRLDWTAEKLLEETKDWEHALSGERPSLVARRAALRKALLAVV